MATGNWVHNFPASKDEHPEYIDWPTAGYDIILAVFLHEIFTALDDMQDALGYDITGGYADLDTRLDNMGFVDRGDPTTFDFTQATLITDGTWQNLDLSSIVPAGAKAVCLYVRIVDDLLDQHLMFRKNGNTYTVNRSDLSTSVANVWFHGDLVVPCDANRVIEYNASNTTWSVISIIVKGWWI